MRRLTMLLIGVLGCASGGVERSPAIAPTVPVAVRPAEPTSGGDEPAVPAPAPPVARAGPSLLGGYRGIGALQVSFVVTYSGGPSFPRWCTSETGVLSLRFPGQAAFEYRSTETDLHRRVVFSDGLFTRQVLSPGHRSRCNPREHAFVRGRWDGEGPARFVAPERAIAGALLEVMQPRPDLAAAQSDAEVFEGSLEGDAIVIRLEPESRRLATFEIRSEDGRVATYRFVRETERTDPAMAASVFSVESGEGVTVECIDRCVP